MLSELKWNTITSIDLPNTSDDALINQADVIFHMLKKHEFDYIDLSVISADLNSIVVKGYRRREFSDENSKSTID